MAKPIRLSASTPLRSSTLLLAATLCLACLALWFLPMVYLVAGIAGFSALLVAVYMIARIIDGRPDAMALVWMLIYPLGYYFLTFPKTKTILTWDRFCVAVLLTALLFSRKTSLRHLPAGFKCAGWLWLGFLIVASTSVLLTWDGDTGPLRILLDSFLLPALLGFYVITQFDVRSNAAKLHGAVCFISIYVAVICAAELALHQDLLPLLDIGDVAAPNTPIFRANGPFITASTPAVVGLANVFLLIFLRQVIGKNMSALHRKLHVAGVAGAFVCAFAPFHRGTVITLAVIAALELASCRAFGSKSRKVLFALPVLTAVVAIKFMPAEVYEDRVANTENIYARVAQQVQNWHVFAAHPLIGVGLNQFNKYVSNRSDEAWFRGVNAMGVPHSNIGSILSETGILGALCYLGSQIFLFMGFRRLAQRGDPYVALAWRCFLYIFLAYNIMGLDAANGYYWELNIWYVFAISICMKFAIREKRQASVPVAYIRQRMLRRAVGVA